MVLTSSTISVPRYLFSSFKWNKCVHVYIIAHVFIQKDTNEAPHQIKGKRQRQTHQFSCRTCCLPLLRTHMQILFSSLAYTKLIQQHSVSPLASDCCWNPLKPHQAVSFTHTDTHWATIVAYFMVIHTLNTFWFASVLIKILADSYILTSVMIHNSSSKFIQCMLLYIQEDKPKSLYRL